MYVFKAEAPWGSQQYYFPKSALRTIAIGLAQILTIYFLYIWPGKRLFVCFRR